VNDPKITDYSDRSLWKNAIGLTATNAVE